jgi:DUF4097 and DUF4098 domain-containing protein YvlB
MTNTFPLELASGFSLTTVSGEVNIEVWDQPQAQVKVIKTSRTERGRELSEVFVKTQGGNLDLRDSGGRRGVGIRYEIKLPVKLREVRIEGKSVKVNVFGVNAPVSIETESGGVSVSGVKGPIEITTKSGAVNLDGITGSVKVATASGRADVLGINGSATVRTVSGGARVVFDKVSGDTPMEFESASGNLEVEFNESFDANLDAETTSGQLYVDEDLGIRVENNLSGQRAVGPIGKGGRTLRLRTKSGSMKIMGRVMPPSEQPEQPEQPGVKAPPPAPPAPKTPEPVKRRN